jgi:hypothetical protein
MSFALAEKKHDAQIRALLKNTPMPGMIKIAYTREPDYFLGVTGNNGCSQTLIYESDTHIKAISCRSIKPVFINGNPMDFGYLSGLRIAPDARNSIILGRGFKAMHSLHEDQKTIAYFTTIIEKNYPAQMFLTSKRAGIPTYRPLGRYVVHTVLLNNHFRTKQDGIEIVSPPVVSIDEITTFLREYGAQKQFFPVYTSDNATLCNTKGFDSNYFFVAVKGSSIIGVAGVWDQRAYKQHTINGYSPLFSCMKPFINIFLRVKGYHSLPATGDILKAFTISFVCICDNNPGILRALIDKIYRYGIKAGYHCMSIGFHENDPLSMAMKDFFIIPYYSALYLVYWDDGKEFCEKYIDNRIPYLELGAL